jgi:predicted XRE-type DNA-binding protein
MSYDDPIPALKRQLGEELARLVAEWNIDDIAFIIGTDRARISDLRAVRLERFSLERLIRFLARLDYSVELTVREARFARREKTRPRSE